MTKQQAFDIFGGREALQEALGIGRTAVAMWKDPLTTLIEERVIAAAYREGKLEKLEIIDKRKVDDA